MFRDRDAWPPAPDGRDPPPPRPPGLTPRQERTAMAVVAVLLIAMFLGPFAGSSVIEGVVALVRSIAR